MNIPEANHSPSVLGILYMDTSQKRLSPKALERLNGQLIPSANFGISQRVRLTGPRDEHGVRADRPDIVGDDGGDVIGMGRRELIDRRTGDPHQPRPAAGGRFLGQPMGMPRLENDGVDPVARRPVGGPVARP
jgi:hypothetical protein